MNGHKTWFRRFKPLGFQSTERGDLEQIIVFSIRYSNSSKGYMVFSKQPNEGMNYIESRMLILQYERPLEADFVLL